MCSFTTSTAIHTHSNGINNLQVDKIAKLGEAPYFDLYVTAPPPTGEVLTYVGTTEQELMYDPQTYLIDYKSNLSSKFDFRL